MCALFVYFLTLRASWGPQTETHSVWTLLLIYTGLHFAPAIALCYSANFAPSPCPIQFKNSSFLAHNAMIASLTGLLASTMVHFLGTAHIAFFFLFQNLNPPLQLWCIDCHLRNFTEYPEILSNSIYHLSLLVCLLSCLISFPYFKSNTCLLQKILKDRLSKRRK